MHTKQQRLWPQQRWCSHALQPQCPKPRSQNAQAAEKRCGRGSQKSPEAAQQLGSSSCQGWWLVHCTPSPRGTCVLARGRLPATSPMHPSHQALPRRLHTDQVTLRWWQAAAMQHTHIPHCARLSRAPGWRPGQHDPEATGKRKHMLAADKRKTSLLHGQQTPAWPGAHRPSGISSIATCTHTTSTTQSRLP